MPEQLLDLVGHDRGSSSSSGEDEIVLGDHAQRQAFEAIEIKEAVLRGERDGLEKRARAGTRDTARAGGATPACRGRHSAVLSAAAYAGTGGSAWASACSSGDGWVLGRAPRGGRCSGTVTRVKVRPSDLGMRGDEPGPVVDVDAIFGLADLELTPDQQIGHRVAMPVHIDVALDVDEAMMERVDLRDEERQRTQVRPFGGEELARTGVQMPFGRGVHLVAEGARLRIEIGEVGKRAPGEEIVFDEMKRALDARRAVGIALFVGPEDEAEALGEGRHLGRRHHPRAGAGGDDDVRVIDHARRGGAAHVLERVGQEDLAVEAIEDRIAPGRRACASSTGRATRSRCAARRRRSARGGARCRAASPAPAGSRSGRRAPAGRARSRGAGKRPSARGRRSSTPCATSSSCTRTRLPRQRSTHSRICSRYGSAFSARSIRGTVGLPAVSTVRTAPREICRARAIWRIPWPFACKLKNRRAQSLIEHRAAPSHSVVADRESPSGPGRRAARRASRSGGSRPPPCWRRRWARRATAPRMCRSVINASGADASGRTGALRRVVGDAQHEQRIGEHQLARGLRAGDVDLIEPADLARAEPVRRDRLDEAHAVGRVGARQRHEVLHRGMRDELAVAARAAESARGACAPDSDAATPSSRCDRSAAPVRPAPGRDPRAACAAASPARARCRSRRCAAAAERSAPPAPPSPTRRRHRVAVQPAQAADALVAVHHDVASRPAVTTTIGIC